MRRRLPELLLAASMAGAILLAAGCGGGVQGTYADPSGAFVLDLKSGGQATFAFAGQTAACTYVVSGSTVNLTCGGDAGTTTLTLQSDGTLTGPPGTFMPPLKKK
jgi:hypothetical protein